MEKFHGFEQVRFVFHEREAVVVLPKQSNGRLALKTEYFGAFPETEVELLKNGFTLAHVYNTNRWGTPDNVDRQAAFIQYVAKEYGLNPKSVLVGMSCGGLEAVYLAAKYPECAGVLYLDAPVMNLCSIPGQMGESKFAYWEEFYQATGLTKTELLTYREHPMDKIPLLAEHHIPIIMLYGDCDESVPYMENGIALEKYYKEHGECIEVVCKEGAGHHPHGLENPQPIVDFILEHM